MCVSLYFLETFRMADQGLHALQPAGSSGYEAGGVVSTGMRNTHDFRLVRLDEVTYESSDELAGMYKLSPFVWRKRTFGLFTRSCCES